MTPNQPPKPLRILLVEDSEHDFEVFRRAFQKSDVPHEIVHYVRAEDALERLKTDAASFDVVVSDYKLPGMNGLELFKELREIKMPLPMVFLTGSGSERLAVEALKAGVDDYLIKDPDLGYSDLLPMVLPSVVRQYEDRIARKQAEEAKERLVLDLQKALAKVKQLSGFIPICGSCKKIRDDKGYWNQIESYLREHSEAEFSHGICPECAKKLYPKYYKEKK